MSNKLIKCSNLTRRERDIVKYMEEVAAIGRSGLSRRELLKMGLLAGAGGMALGMGRKGLAASTLNPQATLGGFSAPCLHPWSDPLYIPPVVQPFDPLNGLNPAAKGIPGAPLSFQVAGLTSSSWPAGCSDPSGCNVTYSEPRTELHQRWGEQWPSAVQGTVAGPLAPLAPAKEHQYKLLARCIPFSFYPTSDRAQGHCNPWIYVDGSDPLCYDPDPIAAGVQAGRMPRLGPVRMVARYGKPSLLRLVNMLPNENYGFGMNKISLHLHNAHNAPVSDGSPLRWFDGWDNDRAPTQGSFWDYHYPNIRAGFSATHKLSTYTDRNGKKWTCAGNFQETLGTLWFHDHKMDFTAQNVYKGLASFYTLFSDDINLDYGDENGDETKGLGLPCGKNFEFDIPLVFGDKMFNPASGEMFMDILNFDGWLGDCQTVNYQIKPYLNVKQRKYRFRLLDGGPSRFYQFYLSVERSDGTKVDIPKPFWRISSDGNLLPNPINQASIRMGVAERVDVIIDFAKLVAADGKKVQVGDTLWLENRLEQTNGRGPTNKILPPSLAKDALSSSPVGTNLLKFIVVALPAGETDASVIPQATRTRPTSLLALPLLPSQGGGVVAQSRQWDFGSSNGAWTVNGKFFDPNVISAQVKLNTWEQWTLTSGGGWAHPVHIHHEEFRIISRNDKPVSSGDEEYARKDVVRIGDNAIAPPSSGSASTGKLIWQMQFRDWVGDYPMHCHNVVHEDHSMMVRWEIIP